MEVTKHEPGLFLLSRASNETPHHPKATLIWVPEVRTWWVSNPLPSDWFTTGTDHSTNEKGQPTKTIGLTQQWAILLPTLEALLEFQTEVEDGLILDTQDGYRTICIYDDYVE